MPVGSEDRDLLQPFADELAREVHADGIVENDGHHGKAELRERAHLFLIRQPEHGALDRIRHQLLDLGGRQRGRVRYDHDLVVRQIGKGFHGNRVERIAARAEQHGNAREHEPAIGEREVDDAVQHYSPSIADLRS